MHSLSQLITLNYKLRTVKRKLSWIYDKLRRSATRDKVSNSNHSVLLPSFKLATPFDWADSMVNRLFVACKNAVDGIG